MSEVFIQSSEASKEEIGGCLSYDVGDILGDLGGYIGLFLGLSLLSLSLNLSIY